MGVCGSSRSIVWGVSSASCCLVRRLWLKGVIAMGGLRHRLWGRGWEWTRGAVGMLLGWVFRADRLLAHQAENEVEGAADSAEALGPRPGVTSLLEQLSG